MGKPKASTKKIVVKLGAQLLHAMEHNDVVAEFDCVTGDEDHPTDVGRFQIFRKEKNCYSKKYSAQMDYAMFFTEDGKAIHMGRAVGLCSYLKYFGADSIGSHGCVRLDEDDAKWLFAWAPMHTPVIVVKGT
jgi:lipoprotein-anchoring transpeptidase ErfK/SrfK